MANLSRWFPLWMGLLALAASALECGAAEKTLKIPKEQSEESPLTAGFEIGPEGETLTLTLEPQDSGMKFKGPAEIDLEDTYEGLTTMWTRTHEGETSQGFTTTPVFSARQWVHIKGAIVGAGTGTGKGKPIDFDAYAPVVDIDVEGKREPVNGVDPEATEELCGAVIVPNADDDDGNSQPDGGQAGAVAGENDLIAVVINRKFELTEVKLEAVSGAAHTKLYRNANRTSPVNLPLPITEESLTLYAECTPATSYQPIKLKVSGKAAEGTTSDTLALLPVEMRSPQAKNDGRYDLSKHDAAIYPHPGNVIPENAQKCLENALMLCFESCTDDDQILARTSTHFVLKAGAGSPLQIQGLSWQTLERPPGAADPTPEGADLIRSVSNDQGALRGGLYRYKLNGTTTEGQVWLPLAGPDISSYWQSEITYFRNVWGPAYRAKLDRRTMYLASSPIKRAALKRALALKDMSNLGTTLDWHGFPKGAYSPCGGPNTAGDEFRLSIHGVVIDFRKRNNMMYALIGREMGIPAVILTAAGDPRTNPLATGAPDTAATKESYRAGFDLHDGVTLQKVMRDRGRKMQEPNNWSRKEWPSWETATESLTRAQGALLQRLIE